jgi:hypothetical protein
MSGLKEGEEGRRGGREGGEGWWMKLDQRKAKREGKGKEGEGGG